MSPLFVTAANTALLGGTRKACLNMLSLAMLHTLAASICRVQNDADGMERRSGIRMPRFNGGER